MKGSLALHKDMITQLALTGGREERGEKSVLLFFFHIFLNCEGM